MISIRKSAKTTIVLTAFIIGIVLLTKWCNTLSNEFIYRMNFLLNTRSNIGIVHSIVLRLSFWFLLISLGINAIYCNESGIGAMRPFSIPLLFSCCTSFWVMISMSKIQVNLQWFWIYYYVGVFICLRIAFNKLSDIKGAGSSKIKAFLSCSPEKLDNSVNIIDRYVLYFTKLVLLILNLLIIIMLIIFCIQPAKVNKEIPNDTHLVGEVFTAKDVSVTIEPVRLFYDKWDSSSGYDGDFVNNGYHFKHGIGMYIPSKTIKNGQTGSTKLGFWLGGGFSDVYFRICTDTDWTSGSKGGTYRVICYINGTPALDTGFNDYTYSKEVKLSVAGADDIVIELQEEKGSDGTLNVILGEFEISKR